VCVFWICLHFQDRPTHFNKHRNVYLGVWVRERFKKVLLAQCKNKISYWKFPTIVELVRGDLLAQLNFNIWFEIVLRSVAKIIFLLFWHWTEGSFELNGSQTHFHYSTADVLILRETAFVTTKRKLIPLPINQISKVFCKIITYI